MSPFTPDIWDDFFKEDPHHSVFYEEFGRLEERLQVSLREFMERPEEERDPQELSQLWKSLQRWVNIRMNFDPLGRGETYTLPRVPFSKPTKRFLGYARKLSPSYCRGLLGRYWKLHNPSLRRSKKRVNSGQSKKKTTTTSERHPPPPLCTESLCPRCEAAQLAEKEVQTFRDPHTDSWSFHRMWRCPRCYWRQSVECGNSEWSHTPPVQRPDEDLGDGLRARMQSRLKGNKKPGPRVWKALGEEFGELLAHEKQIDLALVHRGGRRRRSLHGIEIRFLTELFVRLPTFYEGEIKAHWDKTVKGQYRAGWPQTEVRDFLLQHPRFDAFASLNSQGRCPVCLLPMKIQSTRYLDMDAHTPNPLDLRPTREDTWKCPSCQRTETTSTEL